MQYLSANAYAQKLDVTRDQFATYTEVMEWTKYNGKEITQKGFEAGLIYKSFVKDEEEIRYTAYPIGIINESHFKSIVR